jgi:ribosomal protein S18 acetylase RimI-like enzyme
MSVLQYSDINLTDNLVDVFSVLKELRPHLNFDTFLKVFQDASKFDGYKLTAMKDEKNRILGLMGYRVLNDFVHGRHLYIDDLVIAEAYRSMSLGQKFLDYAENLASLNDCLNLRLCTGKENTRGMKFYEKNNWDMRAVVYKKKLIQ